MEANEEKADIELDYCHPCKERGQSSFAMHWCATCPDLLCEECFGHHKALRATRNHEMIAVKEYRIIGKFLAEFKTSCDDHPSETLNYFCFTHNKACCCVCKDKKHTSPCDVLYENDVMIRENPNQRLLLSIDKINKKVSDVGVLLEENQKNSEYLTEQQKLFEEEILRERGELNTFLDNFESNIKTKFETEFSTRKEILAQEKQQATNTKDQLLSKMRLIQKVNDLNISRMQKLLIGNTVKRELDAAENSNGRQRDFDMPKVTKIFDIQETENLIRLKDGFKMIKPREIAPLQEIALETYDNDIDLSSSVVEEENLENNEECESSKEEEESKTEDKSSKKESESNEDGKSGKEEGLTRQTESKFVLQQHFYVDKLNSQTKVTCAKFVNEDTVVMSEESENQILFYQTNGIRKGELHLDGEPGEIAVKNENSLAVGVGKKIFFVDAKEMKKEVDRYLKDFIVGVTHGNGFYYVCLKHRGIAKLDAVGSILQKIPFIKGNLLICMSINETLYSTKISNMFELKTYNIQTQDRETYSLPYGVDTEGLACDDKGNIYIACDDKDEVLCFDTDSKDFKSILTVSEGVDEIRSVDCTKDGECLMVTVNNGRKIKIFRKTKKLTDNKIPPRFIHGGFSA